MRDRALDKMVEATRAGFGNPTGAHHAARIARRLVDDARDHVADALGAAPAEVVFCGSGTESDNLAVAGAVAARGGRAACSAVEHHAVLRTVGHLGGDILNVDEQGQLDLDQLASICGPDLTVVSVMLANNETGVIQPLEPIRAVLDEHAPQALLHTDAVQGFPWLDLGEHAAVADLISVSGHKFGGPKGVGALVVRSSAELRPTVHGGGQEFGLRSGTHNVAGISAFGSAVAEMHAERPDVVARVRAMRDRLVAGIRAAVPDVIESAVDRPDGSGPFDAAIAKVAGSAHLCFPGLESEALLFLLERSGLCASAASSCSSGAQDPSHVLAAMGFPRELAAGSLRLSLGFGSTDADVDLALDLIPAAVRQLQAAAA